MLPNEVFLACSSQDQGFMARLVETLRRHGVPVWYSQTNILGAQQWHDEIGRALGRCDWLVLLLSPSAVRSEWVKRELLFALQRRRYQKRIVPLLRRRCRYDRLSWTLDSMQLVNFTGNFAAGCRALLKAWGIGYQPAAGRPASAHRPRRRL